MNNPEIRRGVGRRMVLLAGIAVFAGILFATAGCAKDGPAASSACEGFGGGNIVGKWQYRFFGPPVIYEYRPDGTYREDLGGGTVYEGTYEVDGNELRTVRSVGNGTATGNRCFDVQGSVLRMRDRGGDTRYVGTYDRI